MDKVKGVLKFFSDIQMPEMLYGKVLRSPYPHAKIRKIDTSKAERLSGVVAVLTHKDVPGLNGYGIFVQDAPVLCWDKVRYVGDPVALVAATDEETANRALERIEVSYEPLPAVTSVEEALKPDAPKVHKDGNIARWAVVKKGDVEKGFKESDVVIENLYTTHFQKHMYIEPEAGLAFVDDEGVLNLFVAGQNPYRDIVQLSRSLKIPPERIRVVSYPVGGAFGGKDDVTVQIHLGLLALKTKKPVKLVWKREESGIVGFHRHAYKLRLKTGATKDGRITANYAEIISDAGAYQSFGPAVLDVTIELINGPYRIPNYYIDAKLVYTNNGISSAFRGFGAPEANFAIEGQLNVLAEKLGIDKVDIRLKNLVEEGEEGPFGNKLGGIGAIKETLFKVKSSKLWSKKRGVGNRPWMKKGVGIALSIKGVGFGTLPDYPVAVVEILPEGRVKIGFTNPDYGQGVITGNAQIVAEALQIPLGKIEVVNADTGYSPDTGSSSASRSTYTAGNALLLACKDAIKAVKEEAAEYFGVTVEDMGYANGTVFLTSDPSRKVSIYEVAKRMRRKGRSTRFEGTFEVPRHSFNVPGTLEVPHMVYNYGVMLAQVEVDEMLGKVKVNEVEFYVDVGNVVNPLNAVAQCEGGIIQGIGYTLMEELKYEKGYPKNLNFTTYMVPTINDIPKSIYVEFIRNEEETGPYGSKGVGEIPIVPVAACITDAIREAIGVRVFSLPATPERVALAKPLF
jgi:CO/xanthine dehydrogenase Mo-binding subunit